MEIQYNADNETLTVRRQGRLDTLACRELTAALDREWAAGGAAGERLRVVFDLAGVDFVFSAFFRVCMSTARRLAPGHFSIVNASQEVKRAFHVVELDYFFQVK